MKKIDDNKGALHLQRALDVAGIYKEAIAIVFVLGKLEDVPDGVEDCGWEELIVKARELTNKIKELS